VCDRAETFESYITAGRVGLYASFAMWKFYRRIIVLAQFEDVR